MKLPTAEDRAELAQTLERLAARVRTDEVRDFSIDIEHGVRDLVVGPCIQQEHDGSMRVAITVQF